MRRMQRRLRLKAGRLGPGVKLARNSPLRCHWSPHSCPEAGARLAPIPRTACQCLAKHRRALCKLSLLGLDSARPSPLSARRPICSSPFSTREPNRPSPLSAHRPTRSSPLSGEHPAPMSPGSSHGRIFVLWPARICPHIVASLSARSSTHPSPLSAPGPTRSSPLSTQGPSFPSSLSMPYPHPLAVFVGRPSPPRLGIVGRVSRPHVTWIATWPHRVVAGPHSPPRLCVFMFRTFTSISSVELRWYSVFRFS
ncbi:hypothetical protein B0H14DRAFT_3871995 [Mycena olivaceomarginata]|nr:hypothetical protein B0H14DRAFT_3871995 [Mycena olivaceomarginata]